MAISKRDCYIIIWKSCIIHTYRCSTFCWVCL